VDTWFFLQIAAVTENLAAIRRFMEESATRLGVDSAAIPALVLAVDELATNIIVHGYQGRDGLIDIAAGCRGDVFVVRLRDQAPPFDPTCAPLPDIALPLDRRPIGGMGIFFARQIMDAMTYQQMPDGGNELTLVKRGIMKQQTGEGGAHAHRHTMGSGQSSGDRSSAHGRS
jgi:serine/threonine-protein kinase RsbW